MKLGKFSLSYNMLGMSAFQLVLILLVMRLHDIPGQEKIENLLRRSKVWISKKMHSVTISILNRWDQN